MDKWNRFYLSTASLFSDGKKNVVSWHLLPLSTAPPNNSQHNEGRALLVHPKIHICKTGTKARLYVFKMFPAPAMPVAMPKV
jgi:hypothetical protein